MEKLYDSLFTQCTFTGAFITPSLRLGLIVPLLQESEVFKKNLDWASLFVQIQDGITYLANGKVLFGGNLFQISISMRRASTHELAMYGLGAPLPDNERIPKGTSILFEGLNKEKYSAGKVDFCDHIQS